MPQKKDRKPSKASAKKASKQKAVTPAPENTGGAPAVPETLLHEIGSEAVEPEAVTVSVTVEPASAATTRPRETSEPEEPEDLVDHQTTQLDDKDTDRAVDDIAEKEADTMLELQDAATTEAARPAPSGFKAKLYHLLKSKKTWVILFFVVLIVLLVVPPSRYALLGAIIKEPVAVTVRDSRTGSPVSDATVKLAGKSAVTNGSGIAKLKVAPGPSNIAVSKQYYTSSKVSYFVRFKAAATSISLKATGRQVPLTVIDRISGSPLTNAEITTAKTSARTDSKGKATLVLPATLATEAANINLKGYNAAKVSVAVTDSSVPGNTFNLTPAGKVYFLSGGPGNINVAKANLDGTGTQTIVEATGQEDSATSLSASSDWRYLVLKSRRDTAQPALYLLDTSNDKLTAFDSSNSNFTLIGWYGHNFMYEATSNTTPSTQNGHETIKSYDADHQQLNQLDQSQTEAVSPGYAYQHFYNFYVLNNLLTYTVQWQGSGVKLENEMSSIRGVQPDGQNKKDYQTFPSAGLGTIQAVLYQPQAVYYAVPGNSGTTYYNFANQTVNTVPIDASAFSRAYPTYYSSPAKNQTLWAGAAGTGALYTGDANAAHQQQVTNGGNYTAYGWYTQKYVFASVGGQLYIGAASSSAPNHAPVKIGAVYQTASGFQNYAYSYGGK